jgi:tRNA(adenine34) deaminase
VADPLPRPAEDERFMDDALAEARAALEHGDVPVGAVVVHAGAVVGRGHNRREVDRDPTAHAEILALREAATRLGRWRLFDCALYVTIEPCPMCAGAAQQARVDLVVYGAPDEKAGAARSIFELLDDPRLNHRAKLRAGVRRSEVETLMREAFLRLRSRD